MPTKSSVAEHFFTAIRALPVIKVPLRRVEVMARNELFRLGDPGHFRLDFCSRSLVPPRMPRSMNATPQAVTHGALNATILCAAEPPGALSPLMGLSGRGREQKKLLCEW